MDLAQPGHPVLLNVNGERNMMPASLSKLATATAILQKFGPTYKFETGILSDAPRDGARQIEGPDLLARAAATPASFLKRCGIW